MHEFMRAILRWRAILGVCFCALGALLVLAPPNSPTPAAALSTTEARATSGFNGVDVVQIDGLIDPPNASLMLDAIHDAEARGSTALVFQMDSEGVVATDPWRLAQAIRNAKVPIAVWVGPSGAQARGGSAIIAAAAPFLSLASNATIGPINPMRLDEESVVEAHGGVPLPVFAPRLLPIAAIDHHEIGASQAKTLKLSDSTEPVIVDLIGSLDGKTIATAAGPQKLSTAEVVKVGNAVKRKPNQDVRFRKLSINGQFQHTLGSPWAAFFLFAVGASLVLFEFFTISVGIAGVVGATCLAFASFGFSHLPVRWWAVAILVLAFVGYGIDVQAGGLGPWTIIGTAALIGGSLTLYGGSSELDPAWWILILVWLGVVTFMLGGMTAMLRSRFSTPTVGREAMIGEVGLAETAINPDGLLTLRDTVWKARTNRATPLAMGDHARVVAVEGLVLEVEPEAGGAKDYRDRGRPIDTQDSAEKI